ncbi:TonB-dependent receptor [Shewanella submarina]|uniref:TonB-dependent receptor plug domain-containing protein n=1 Tax=Shewanella submarina TaxID=2016376 RepID=A0ABV7GKB9_9GAMM|nr:TonB-dependent receptor [Shewanella submarina]MCL1036305.1 TonB-dependent receptor [Shewanella submarina]
MKVRHTSLYKAMVLAFASGTGAMMFTSSAAAEDQQAKDENIEKIAVVGTRAAPRSVTDSPVPLDIISGDEFVRQGSTDLKSLMSSVTPSFNVNDQPINDASTLVRPANLRGLAADHTLVLVNGKRRHRSAVITFLGGGLSDGAQGPDISNIPVSALKQVEVLRDGAAAQYGSDAIAGVINFVLKDSSDGGMLEARYGQYYEGDGDTVQLSGNIGMPLSENGFANFSAEYRTVDDTSRSVQRSDAQGLIDAGNTFVPVPAQIWGTPEIKSDFKFLANFGLDLNDTDEAYMWLNYAKREVDGGFYYRNPTSRGGVNKGIVRDVNGVKMYRPDPKIDPVGAAAWDAANPTILVGSLDGLDQQLNCPIVELMPNGLPDQNALNSLAAANCFAFNNLLPGGFTPRFGGEVTDMAMVMGTRGEFGADWGYDLSASLGYSNVDYSIYNTINPSLGADTPFEFEPGSYTQIEQTYNFDITKGIDISGWDEPVNFAAGLEYRVETFKIEAGDAKSFAIGPLATQGFGVGSNGFPGFKPEDAGTWSRYNWAAYVDIESYLNEDWLMTAALRFEDFSDFGTTLNWKLSTHYQIGETIGLRAAASTGFRAPTVGQSNVRNVTTAFSASGLEDQATLPPTNPISVQKGGEPLEPEESVNLSAGLVAEFDNGIYLTVDYFHIKLKDRISQTSAITLTPGDINKLQALGINDASSFSSVKFFTNDFDTTTQGVDLVANYNTELFGGDTKFAFAYNWTDTKVDSRKQAGTDDEGNPIYNINDAKVEMLEDNLPAHRFTFTTDWRYQNVDLLARVNYYGNYFEDHLDSGGELPIYVGSEITLDVEATYHWTDALSTSIGAQNLLDNTPDVNPWKDEVGSLYPATSPMGINGGFYYVRANYTF